MTGRPINGQKAFHLGLVDAIVAENDALLKVTKKWGTWASLLMSVEPSSLRRVGQLKLKETPAQVKTLCRAAAQKLPPSEHGGESLHCALQAVQACTKPLEEGMEIEKWQGARKEEKHWKGRAT